MFGASGYSGGEAVRLLAEHPSFALAAVGANDHAGEPLTDVHPHLAGLDSMTLERLDASVADRVDAAILALPHAESPLVAPDLLEAGVRVVDMSGAFRLPADAYPEWYGFDHPAEAWLGKAVTGLPELYPDRIADAELVANPGCYPTAAALALVPPVRAGLLPGHRVVIDAKSGVSGAGAAPSAGTHFARADGSVRPYRIGSHQHTPEIELLLAAAAGREVSVTFVPHLVPATRGLLVTCYAEARDAPAGALVDSLAEAHEGSPFIRVLPIDEPADPKRVTASNTCEIGVSLDRRTGTAVITAAVDNLIKGAAGQAVQNLNLMFGIDQAAGLPRMGVFP
ncbi:MAG: N-acetyl-gamma-glutamyl-phosphate reductase [Actinomycetota bacterium]